MQKRFFLSALCFLLISACTPAATPRPQATVAPLVLPPTWTPTLAPTAIPTFTNIPTFTAVPAFTPLSTPTNDSIGALSERFQDSLFSPNGQWVARRDPEKLRVVRTDATRVWTLPCELFKECSTVYPVKWSRKGPVLYFAPAPTVGGAPIGISLVTAMGMINVRTGKWQIVLPDSDRYYDLAFSPDEEYLAYTQSSGFQADNPTVTLGVLTTKNQKAQEVILNEAYGGNIVWSPFKSRFVFVVQSLKKGSSVVYYDVDTSVLKYVVEGEQGDVLLSTWNEENNLVMMEERDWLTHSRSYFLLNPFTGDISSVSITATPPESELILTPTATETLSESQLSPTATETPFFP
jgi:hypothetical protein